MRFVRAAACAARAGRTALASAVVAMLVALSSAHVARADALPTKDGHVRPGCAEPAGMECVTGGHSRAHVAADACTSAELARLGLRFHCEESHNDRVTAYWCRPTRGGNREPLPAGLHDELTAGSYADDHAFRTLHGSTLRSVEALREAGAEVPANLLARETMARDAEAAREPCKRLAAKYMRCGLETEKCRRTWIRLGLVQDAGADELAAIEAESRDASVDAANGVDAAVVDAGGSPPKKESARCGCRAIGNANGARSGPLVMLLALAILARRRSAARASHP